MDSGSSGACELLESTFSGRPLARIRSLRARETAIYHHCLYSGSHRLCSREGVGERIVAVQRSLSPCTLRALCGSLRLIAFGDTLRELAANEALLGVTLTHSQAGAESTARNWAHLPLLQSESRIRRKYGVLARMQRHRRTRDAAAADDACAGSGAFAGTCTLRQQTA